MKLPSPQILIAILLCTVSIVAQGFLVRILCLLTLSAILLIALVRVLPHDRQRAARVLLHDRQRAAIAVIVGVLALVALGGMWLTRPSLQLNYASDQLKGAPELSDYRGVYEVETDPAGNRYTWTQERMTLVVDLLVHKPITLTVLMRSAAIAGGPDAPVQVVVDNVVVGELRADPKNPTFQPQRLRFVPPAWGGEQMEVKLLATPFLPAGETRQLGTMIQSVSIDRREAWAAAARRLQLLWALPLIAFVAGGFALAARRSGNRRYGHVAIGLCSAACGLTLLLLGLLLGVGVIAIPVYHIWLLGTAYLVCAFAAAAVFLAFQYTEAPRVWQSMVVRPVPRMLVRNRERVARHWMAAEPDGVRIGNDARALILRDLAAVFLIALAVRAIWVFVTPPWQAPDEPAHFIYMAHIAEQNQIPHPPFPAYPSVPLEYYQSAALTLFPQTSAAGAGTPTDYSYLPVTYDYQPARTYRAPDVERLSQAGSTAAGYPPLYYLLEAIPYKLFQGAPILSRIFATRLGSALMGALSCLFGYLLAYELRRERLWGWALGLCMALMPMYAFITASDNNDAAMDLFATALIWLTARAWLRATISPRLALAMGAASGLVLLSKPTGLAMAVVASIVVLVKAFSPLRTWRVHPRSTFSALGIYAAAITVLYGPWIVFRLHYYKQIAMIPVGRLFQLLSGVISVSAASPRLGVSASARVPSFATTHSYWSYLQYERQVRWGDYFRWLFIDAFWGNFGWLDAPMPQQILRLITIFCLIGLIGFGVQIILQKARRGTLLLLLGIVLAQVVFLLGISNYFTLYRATGVAAGNQGRYFFPILAPALFLLLSGWHHLMREHSLALRIAPALMLVVQMIGLATILARYYGVVIG